MRIYLSFGLILFFGLAKIFAQGTFSGSFLMTFKSEDSSKDFPFHWFIQPKKEGNKMVMEIQDDMLSKGVTKRVLFDPLDSTWTMLINFNKVKQGTKIHAAAMFRDTVKHRPVKITNTKETKRIDNLNCKKIIVESDRYIANVWYTEEIKFNLCGIYRLLSHCGMMSEFLRKGDWFMNRKLKTMVLEVDSKDKQSGKSYELKITHVNDSIDASKFSINGFRIADIPEGQNCGVEIKEE